MRVQKRTRGIAKLLAVSLILSGLSVTPSYAAEIVDPEETVEMEKAVDPEGTADAEETADPEEAVDPGETADPGEIAEHFSVPEMSVRMAGSDGVFYDDVLYLSAGNVQAMDERLQARYRRLCDEIAEAKKDGVEVKDAVFAMDEDGRLHCSYSVSMRGLDVIAAEMLSDLENAPGLEEAEALHLDAGVVNAEAGEAAPEKGSGADPGEEEDTALRKDKENPEEENAVEKKDVTDTEEGENAAEKKDVTDTEEGEDAAEKKDVTDTEEGENAAEKKDVTDTEEGEDAAEKKDVTDTEEGEDAAEKKDVTVTEESENALGKEEAVPGGMDTGEESAIVEENMEKISRPEAETFEVTEPVRLMDRIDLGYGRSDAGGIQAYSLLPSEDYYRDQLTDVQKMVYDAAKDTLTKGTTQFTVTVQDNSELDWDDMTRAVSALMLAYPAETDWMRYCPDRSYGMYNEYDPSGLTEKVVVTFGISDFYSSSLEQWAQEKVKEVGQLAVQYAVENYPDVLTYGIVKYLDQWVCENGYYKKGGGTAIFNEPNPTDEQRKTYYMCHTAYGILLEGYGVCESYAKTMSRLLDAVGIPNLFITGDWYTGGKPYGHAWNYVQMPNGKWYLLDSTYNDASGPPAHKKSTMQYLLVKDDGKHVAIGAVLHILGEANFTFPTLADSSYDSGSEYEENSDFGDENGRITLGRTECSLLPKEKETLTYTIEGDWDYSRASVVWSSSDTKVAKVDQNGGVTAVAPGTATVFLTSSGMAAECRIYVDQVRAVKSENTGKTGESVSLGINGEKKDKKTIALAVDMGKSPHTAEWIVDHKKVDAPQAVCSSQSVAVTDVSVSGNRITVALQAMSQGNAKVSVKFAGKTVTLSTAAGQLITEEMFNVTWPEAIKEEDGSRVTPYTGKAIKPVVKKKPDAQYKPVTFKTTYVHNKEAGTARVLVTGSGKYGGTIEYAFAITPLDITGADFSKTLKSKPYNGGSNPPATVVKLNKKTLKAGRDYEILYNKKTESDIREKNGGAVPVGSYTITIIGKGNYTGTVSQTQPYTVTPNTIAKVSAAGAGSAKYTGVAMKPYTVKIGRNVLPDTDYKITWYRGQGKKRSATPLKAAPVARGKFTAVITVEGSNLTVTENKKEIVKNFTIK